MKKECRPQENKKVLALYQAVISLIENEGDINSMKVSDITSQAGIGKGTAYEYFESKEEIIVNALVFDMHQQLERLRETVEQASSLKMQVNHVFDWLAEKDGHLRTRTQFFHMLQSSCEIREAFMEKFGQKEGSCKSFWEILEPMERQAEREGILNGNMPESWRHMCLLSGFLNFFLFVSHRELCGDVTEEGTREFLYESVVRNFAG